MKIVLSEVDPGASTVPFRNGLKAKGDEGSKSYLLALAMSP